MRDIIHRHNLLNGVVFSVVEFGLIAGFVGAFAVYYAVHQQIGMALIGGGIALNCVPVIIDGIRELLKCRAGKESVGAFWDKAAREQHRRENPHMLRDTLALTIATLIPFLGFVAVLIDLFKRRDFPRDVGVVIALLFLPPHASAAPPHRPNILYIVADDLGYGEAGCYGGKDIPTPNIDSLAAGGVRLTSGYVTAPFCAASRAALMTGRYQTRFGFEFNPIGAKNAAIGIGLPAEEKTIAERLRDAGYATALVGKWHLGGTAPFHPQRRGFDEFFGFLQEGHFYVPQPWNGATTWLRRKALPDGSQGRWTSPDGRVVWSTHLHSNEPEYDADNPLLRSSQPVEEKGNLTDAFTREACSFIERHQSQPWFLYLAYNAVHSPMQGMDTYMEKFANISDIQRRIFAAMLAQLDDGIGRVLAQLRASGLEENTLIVFLSDNGGPTKELTSSNAPLRGGKGDLWDGGIRIPFIISWKGQVPAGHTLDAPIISMDATATALDLAGAATDQAKLDGADLLPLLTGKTATAPHDTLFWRVGRKNALRHGEWKLIREGGAWRLYNLAHDVGETTDLAAQNASRVTELAALWDKWNAEQIEPLWK